MSDWNAGIIEEFRANAGVVGGVFSGKPLLLLHNTGAKSGKARVSPLMYQKLDAGYAVFGSKAGAHTNPDWYYNVVTNPDVSIEVGTESFDLRARVASGEEHDRIWARQKDQFGQFAEYEQKTDRVIPVIILEPKG